MQEYFCFDGAIAQGGDESAYLYSELFDYSSCVRVCVLLSDNRRSKNLLNFSYRQPLAKIPK